MMQEVNQVIILDPGIKGPLGHHPPADHLIRRHFDAQNTPVRVLVNRECNEDVAVSLSAEKTLTPSTYIKHPPEPNQFAVMLEDTNNRVADDLQESLPTVSDGALIIIHTASMWHLFGLSAWARDNVKKALSFRIVLRFPSDFTPFEECQSERFSVLAKDAWRRLFAAWNELSVDAKFFADTDQAVKDYGALGQIDVHPIPMPIDFPTDVGPSTETTRDGGPRHLLLGAIRKEKGLPVIEKMIGAFVAQGGAGTIVMQAPQFMPQATRAKLQAYGDKIQILDQPMLAPEFLDFISTGDVVLMPYDPDQYRERSSQIFLEALGMGKPVIVTANTWMHAELAKLNPACGIAASHSGDAFATAMLDVENRLDQFTAKAASIAPKIRATHNAQEFLRVLLA